MYWSFFVLSNLCARSPRRSVTFATCVASARAFLRERTRSKSVSYPTWTSFQFFSTFTHLYSAPVHATFVQWTRYSFWVYSNYREHAWTTSGECTGRTSRSVSKVLCPLFLLKNDHLLVLDVFFYFGQKPRNSCWSVMKYLNVFDPQILSYPTIEKYSFFFFNAIKMA